MIKLNKKYKKAKDKDKLKNILAKIRRWFLVIKQMAWNTFKNTGSIDSYLELTKVKDIEEDIQKKQLIDEVLKTEIKIREDLQ